VQPAYNIPTQVRFTNLRRTQSFFLPTASGELGKQGEILFIMFRVKKENTLTLYEINKE
jgi:hypothetical protein